MKESGAHRSIGTTILLSCAILVAACAPQSEERLSAKASQIVVPKKSQNEPPLQANGFTFDPNHTVSKTYVGKYEKSDCPRHDNGGNGKTRRGATISKLVPFIDEWGRERLNASIIIDNISAGRKWREYGVATIGLEPAGNGAWLGVFESPRDDGLVTRIRLLPSWQWLNDEPQIHIQFRFPANKVWSSICAQKTVGVQSISG